VTRATGSAPDVMRGPELYGRELQNVRWTPDGRSLAYVRSYANRPPEQLPVHGAATAAGSP